MRWGCNAEELTCDRCGEMALMFIGVLPRLWVEWQQQPPVFERNPGGWVSTEEWIKWARGTWADIQETDVLDGYRSARDEDDERHVCPLQLDWARPQIAQTYLSGEMPPLLLSGGKEAS